MYQQRDASLLALQILNHIGDMIEPNILRLIKTSDVLSLLLDINLIKGGGYMRKLLLRNSTKILIFVALIAFTNLNWLELIIVARFISGFSENRNFNFGESILISERSIAF